MRDILLLACALIIMGCADDRAARDASYEWLKKTAAELEDDEALLRSAGKYLAFLEARGVNEVRPSAPEHVVRPEEETPVVDYRLLAAQYPKWLDRHNKKVRSYNDASEAFDWTSYHGRSDAPRRRFWRLTPESMSLQFAPPGESLFTGSKEE